MPYPKVDSLKKSCNEFITSPKAFARAPLQVHPNYFYKIRFSTKHVIEDQVLQLRISLNTSDFCKGPVKLFMFGKRDISLSGENQKIFDVKRFLR